MCIENKKRIHLNDRIMFYFFFIISDYLTKFSGVFVGDATLPGHKICIPDKTKNVLFEVI